MTVNKEHMKIKPLCLGNENEECGSSHDKGEINGKEKSIIIVVSIIMSFQVAF